MDHPIHITLLANAGLALQYEGHTFLIDALQKSEHAPFSPLPPTLWQEILYGGGSFAKVDALLFTHLHPDHFTADMVLAYLKHHPNTRLILPEDRDAPGYDAVLVQSAGHMTALHPLSGPQTIQLAPDVSVQTLPIRHLDKLYYDVPHVCFLITCGAKRILLTSDMDYTHDTLAQLDGTPLCAAFVNPLFFSALRSGHFFKGTLDADHICVYHIPFAPDDRQNMRSFVRREAALWQKSSRIILLNEPLQTIEL